MAPKQPCAKYQYVVTASGPKIVPVPDVYSKDEEAPADYNSGGYLQVKINDTFKDGRYLVLRKLGYVSLLYNSFSRRTLALLPFCGPFSTPGSHHTTSWGHFSTVWLAKDNQ